MPFCPKCRFEYKPDVSVCPDCEEELVLTLPPEDAPEVTDENRTWKLLYTAVSRSAAEFLLEALRQADIPSVMKPSGRFYGKGAAGGLGSVSGFGDGEIMVDEQWWNEAVEIRTQTVGDEDSAHGFLPKSDAEK
jgi:hypothetical protein